MVERLKRSYKCAVNKVEHWVSGVPQALILRNTRPNALANPRMPVGKLSTIKFSDTLPREVGEKAEVKCSTLYQKAHYNGRPTAGGSPRDTVGWRPLKTNKIIHSLFLLRSYAANFVALHLTNSVFMLNVVV